MWSITSSISQYDQHLLFCCVLSIFDFTELVLIALFFASMRKDLVSLLRFSFYSHNQVFSSQISPVCRLKYPYKGLFFLFCFQGFVVLLIFMLSALLLVAVISLFLTESSSLCIDISTLSLILVSPLLYPRTSGDESFRVILLIRCPQGIY